MARVWNGEQVSEEITLPGATIEALMADPVLMEKMDVVREQGGTAGLIGFLDAHGLPWRPGGSDPLAAFADAFASGAAPVAAPPRRPLRRVDEAERAAEKSRRRAVENARRKARRR